VENGGFAKMAKIEGSCHQVQPVAITLDI